MTDPLPIEPFLSRVADPVLAAKLFDHFDNLTFFVKDDRGRYLVVNQTLALRCGFKTKAALLEKTAVKVDPKPLGDYFLCQDLELIRTARPLINELEQHPLSAP